MLAAQVAPAILELLDRHLRVDASSSPPWASPPGCLRFNLERPPLRALYFRYSVSFSRRRRVVMWAYIVVVLICACPRAS